jgi:hypothetical protein
MAWRLTFVTGHVLEWRDTAQELVREHTQSPVVHLLVVLLSLYHLRRQVVERSAERRSSVSGSVHRPAKVGDLELAVQAEQQVFGLDVAVDDMLAVEVL